MDTVEGAPNSKGRARIRHLAIWAKDPEMLATFYSRAFGMEILNRTPTATYLTDGYINLALLHHRPEIKAAPGLNHFGFIVEDAEEVSTDIAALGIEAPKKKPPTRPYAEYGGRDPEGNMFDLSEHGYDEAEYGGEPTKI